MLVDRSFVHKAKRPEQSMRLAGGMEAKHAPLRFLQDMPHEPLRSAMSLQSRCSDQHADRRALLSEREPHGDPMHSPTLIHCNPSAPDLTHELPVFCAVGPAHTNRQRKQPFGIGVSYVASRHRKRIEEKCFARHCYILPVILFTGT